MRSSSMASISEQRYRMTPLRPSPRQSLVSRSRSAMRSTVEREQHHRSESSLGEMYFFSSGRFPFLPFVPIVPPISFCCAHAYDSTSITFENTLLSFVHRCSTTTRQGCSRMVCSEISSPAKGIRCRRAAIHAPSFVLAVIFLLAIPITVRPFHGPSDVIVNSKRATVPCLL
jgi:hypothetical protein